MYIYCRVPHYVCNPQVFSEIDVVANLQIAAKKGSKLTACHCCKALCTIGAPLPIYQSWNVLKWQPDQVCGLQCNISAVCVVYNLC